MDVPVSSYIPLGLRVDPGGLLQLLGLCYLALSEIEMARKVWEKGLELDRSNQALLNYLEEKKNKQIIVNKEISTSKREVAATTEKRSFRYYGLVLGAAGILCLALIIPASHYFSQKQGNAFKPSVTRDFCIIAKIKFFETTIWY